MTRLSVERDRELPRRDERAPEWHEDGVDAARLIVELDSGRVVEGNAAGWQLLVGKASGPGQPYMLDAANPALAVLRGAVPSIGPGQSRLLELVHWTAEGVRRGIWRVSAADGTGGEGAAGDGAICNCAGRCVLKLAKSDRRADGAAHTGKSDGDPAGARQADQGMVPASSMLVRHLAHELRTPLSAIASLAEAMHGGYLGPMGNQRHREYMASIGETARHALEVVHEMVARQIGRPAALGHNGAAGSDVNAIVAGVVESMGIMAERAGATLVLELHPGMPRAVVKVTALRQMLMNLVANAISHAGPTAVVTVRTGAEDGRHVWVEVADNGPGIPDGVVAHVREGGEEPCRLRKVSADITSQGLGLGLTRTIAEAEGGQLVIASNADGARVQILLKAEGAR